MSADHATRGSATDQALAATLATTNPEATIRPRALDSTISADAVDITLPDEVARKASGELEPFAQRLALGTTLGEGGMAVVRVATQRSLGREVAVKMMRPDATDDASPRMLREAWITGALEHPNIVPVHDLGTDEQGRPMLVLKRIEGRPWSELIRECGLEWNLQTFVHVCNAIAFAHSRRIVHRDLKPANIMIGGFGEVYVLDWGIAVSLVDDGSGRLPLAKDCTELAGTLAYMAPEMLGNAPLDERTDTYLLGAILFEIATGKPPHLCKTIETTIGSIRATPPVLADDVPAELAAIVRRALAKASGDRYASADDLHAAVSGFLEHRGSAALAHEAGEQVNELERHLATDRSDASAHRVRTYQLFGQSRFGFQAALRAWPDNPAAREGLDRALTAMASYELDLGDARAASVLIAEITSPPAALTERLAVVERGAADREKRLARFEADADVNTSGVIRTCFLVLCGLVWCALPFVAGAFPALEVGHGMSILATSAMVGGIVAFGWVTRGAMLQTAVNRGIFLTALLGVALHGLVEAVAWAIGLDMVLTHMISVGLWAGCTGIAAVFLDRAMLLPTLCFLGTIAAIALRPATHLMAMSASCVVLFGVVFYIYRMQLHGRTIGGLADKLRPR